MKRPIRLPILVSSTTNWIGAVPVECQSCGVTVYDQEANIQMVWDKGGCVLCTNCSFNRLQIPPEVELRFIDGNGNRVPRPPSKDLNQKGFSVLELLISMIVLVACAVVLIGIVALTMWLIAKKMEGSWN